MIVTYKVFPTEVEVDLDDLYTRIRDGLPEEASISRSSVEPIAFGLKALVLDVAMPEEEGITDRVEGSIKSRDGVGELQVISQRRTLRV